MDHVDSNSNQGLFRDTGKGSVEQSDCTAQLLRLLILCHCELEKTVKKSKLTKEIDRLHLRLLEFYIPAGEGRGSAFARRRAGRSYICRRQTRPTVGRRGPRRPATPGRRVALPVALALVDNLELCAEPIDRLAD